MTTGATPVAAQTVSPQSVQNGAETAIETAAVYVPSEVVVDAPQTDDAIAEAVTAAVAEQHADAAPLVEPGKLVMFVSVSSANVRNGPSKDFSVIDKLSRGEAVTVVSASDDPEGWTLIRIEGDGIEGYVSNALLADQP